MLSRLHHQRGLLVKGGAGPATYYQLAELPGLPLFPAEGPDGSELDANTSDLRANTSDLDANTGDLDANTGDLGANTGDLPEPLRHALATLSPKARQDKLWPLILWLCALRPQRAEQLAQHLGRQVKTLKSSHLNPLREQQGLLQYRHPEVINHPQQAYVTSAAGRLWLAEQGIVL